MNDKQRSVVFILLVIVFGLVVVSNISFVSSISGSANTVSTLFLISEIISAFFIGFVFGGLLMLYITGEKSIVIYVFGLFAALFFIDRIVLTIGYLS